MANSPLSDKIREVISCMDRQCTDESDSAILLALDSKALRQGFKKPDFEFKGKSTCLEKTGFVAEYNRSSLFNFAEISGTLRVDRRFYLR